MKRNSLHFLKNNKSRKIETNLSLPHRYLHLLPLVSTTYMIKKSNI
jgi:hypothetical protein